MTALTGIILYMLAIVLLAIMLWQGLSRSVDFFSVRNFFLLGLIVFQLISGALAVHSPQYRDFGLVGLPRTGVIYTGMILMFLFLFFLAYNRGWGVNWLARKTPVGNAAPATASMLTLAVVFLCVGIVCRILLSRIPVVAPAFFIMGSGMLAVSAGMAAWVWGSRMFNPVIAIAAAVITIAALLAVLSTDFGRRAVLGVVGCFGWGAYHGSWKHLEPKALLMRLGGIGLAALVVVAAFTAGRDSSARDRTLGQAVSSLRTANIKEGVHLLATGQDAGRNSMWLIENYPDRFSYDTLHTMRYFLLLPVPRIIYPDKPEAIGRVAVSQANADRRRASNYSIGPGLMGHIAVDNPWIALPLYAILGGLLIGYLDRLIWLHPTNPFVVLPIGTTLGQVVGLARGETGLFLFHATLGIAGAWIGMFLCAKAMSLMGWRMQYAEDEEQYGDDGLWSDDPPPDPDGFAPYGDEERYAEAPAYGVPHHQYG